MEGQAIFEKIEAIKMPVRISILIAIIFLFSGAFLWLIYFPSQGSIKTATTAIGELDKQLLSAKRERAKLPEKQKEKEAVESQFAEALNMLPNSKEIPSLLRKITQLGNEAELDFRVFTPKPETAKEFYMEIPVSIEVSGTYHNVAVFFDKVGQMERIINIRNVSMKPVSDRSTTLITTCDAITYRFKGN
jgi:type IV pilus assembly protein PilO